jgi:predicted acyltransferase (DUF342 family)
MPFDKKTLVIPNETFLEDDMFVTNGDTVIDYKTDVQYGFKTEKRIFVGDSVKIHGSLDAEDDIRIDTLTEVDGNIRSSNDIYLGERVHVKGKLSVGRDLDVGNHVKLDEGYEAKGWINVQSSISWLTFIFAYIIYLLRRGESQQVNDILDELENENPFELLVSEVFMFIPKRSVITKEEINIQGNCRIGDKCKLRGNYRISGSMKIGAESELEGSIDAEEDIELAEKVVIKGPISTRGTVRLGEEASVEGDIHALRVEMYQSSIVGGTIHAEEGTKQLEPEEEEKEADVEDGTKARVGKFDHGMENIGDMLD